MMIFLKLGGSLITDKAAPETPRPDVIRRLAEEVVRGWKDLGQVPLLLGHGSGSFGHQAAAKWGTERGAKSKEQWLGFAEVWWAAQRLNGLVMEALRQAGAPAIALPPSASALCREGKLVQLATEPVQRALSAGLIPVVYGDVAFDERRGACIISTERVFNYLAQVLHPSRVLLAGIEPGVFSDFPRSTDVLSVLTAGDLPRLGLQGAETTDVTGGMADKVREALELAKSSSDVEVRIFSGEPPGSLFRALVGEASGTLVAASHQHPT